VFGVFIAGLDDRIAFLTAGAMGLVALAVLHGVVALRMHRDANAV
jgi:hypothetical protein